MLEITSAQNPRVAALRALRQAKGRAETGLFLAEGRKLCPELARGAQLETLFYTESAMAKCPELADLPGDGDVHDAQILRQRSGHADVHDGVRGVAQDHGLGAHGGIDLADAAHGGHDGSALHSAPDEFDPADGFRFRIRHGGLQLVQLQVHGGDDADGHVFSPFG